MVMAEKVKITTNHKFLKHYTFFPLGLILTFCKIWKNKLFNIWMDSRQLSKKYFAARGKEDHWIVVSFRWHPFPICSFVSPRKRYIYWTDYGFFTWGSIWRETPPHHFLDWRKRWKFWGFIQSVQFSTVVHEHWRDFFVKHVH